MYATSNILVSLAWVAVGLLTLGVAFMAFQASSSREGLAPLKIAAGGFALLGLASVASPLIGWLLGLLAASLGHSSWYWIGLAKGIIGAGVDGIGFAAIGFSLWKLSKA